MPARLAAYHDDPHGAFRGWNDIWLDPAFESWSIEEFLPNIRCPVLVIQGENDEYGTRAQLDAIASGAVGVETILLPACGHTPHREQERATLEAVGQFIERITPGLTRTVPLDT